MPLFRKRDSNIGNVTDEKLDKTRGKADIGISGQRDMWTKGHADIGTCGHRDKGHIMDIKILEQEDMFSPLCLQDAMMKDHIPIASLLY